MEAPSLHFPLLLLFIVYAQATFAAAATIGPKLEERATSCACGYQDSNGHVWREQIISDFSGSAAMTAVNKDWSVQTWGAQRTHAYMQNTAANVYAYNNYLGIKTTAHTGNGSVYTGEIQTLRQDILYGSFRMIAEVPTTPGVCFGFFSYESDTQETDIEFLSSDTNYQNTVHYTNQPRSTSGSTKQVTVSGDLRQFGLHRFDWLPTQTMFYYANKLYATLTMDVPKQASSIQANVWSDGDPTWTKGPPTANAVATIQYIHLFFNSTSLSAATFQQNCVKAGKPAVCMVN